MLVKCVKFVILIIGDIKIMCLGFVSFGLFRELSVYFIVNVLLLEKLIICNGKLGLFSILVLWIVR